MKHSTTLTRFIPTLMGITISACLYAQMPALPQGLHDRIQTVQQAAAQNEHRLHQYQWIETMALTINGSPKPQRQSLCKYGPAGNLIKTPLGAPEQLPRPSGGPLMASIELRKIMQVQQELATVKELTAMYLPLNPDILQQSIKTRRVDLEHDPSGTTSFVIHDYAKPGDSVAFNVDIATNRLQQITVHSFFESGTDNYIATVQFGMLPDGTVYPTSTMVEAPHKRIAVTTFNTSFIKAVQ